MPADPYATHLPVLREIGRQYPIRRVLEFGAGLYSTPLFLDRTAFPVLESLVSIEDDWAWLQTVKVACPDRRLSLRYGGLFAAQQWVDVEDYDLILIDSGKEEADRVPVIEWIAGQRPSAVVVIHDYERTAYQEAAKALGMASLHDERAPWTAVFMAEGVRVAA